MPRDPDVAQRALAQVQRLLHRQHIVQQITERQHFAEDDARHELVSRLTHKQHEAELRAVIDDLHPADIAYVLEALPPDDRAEVWGLVAPEADAETLGEVLLEASEAVCESLVEALSHERLVQIAAALDADQLADLAPLLPQAVIDEVTQSLTTEEREDFRAALSFEEGSVGARMVFEMVTIRDDVTLETVLRYLRLFDELPDHTDQVFVIDRDDHLKGALSLNTLLVNDPDATVADLMQTEIFTLHAEDDASDAAQAFERYDFVSAPVIDRRGRLIGRLTVAEIVDVIREETEEQVLSAAGLREEEDMFSSVWESAKNRWLWLGINMGTAFFASRVIGAFEGTIERIVALAALMPIVAGIAGNSGNQTMTLLIRSIALGQITPANVRRLMLKELAVALANGVVWGTVAATFAVLLYFSAPYVLKLGTVMFMAMVLNMLVGAAVGMAVPMLLKKLGRDPAMGSSVLLTFTTDSGGFFIFLGLATLFFS
ncbi:magnesium transporter [Derxia gummosa]|uniref:Magnesium transporter MgtE n=1 Tax=Derxia gummosa DSM 723 TaxID=1121388 RepID=A0A8B6X254_9BURK|nr:magnesium transporter [Derxia gummosa]